MSALVIKQNVADFPILEIRDEDWKMVLTEPVVHREELLLVPHQDVCAPPKSERRIALSAKKINI